MLKEKLSIAFSSLSLEEWYMYILYLLLGHLSHSGDQLQLIYGRRPVVYVNNFTFLTS